jgi:phosphatidylserine/phosphatidylglycerophosphate/cardiolipin synthase-like enzyme
MQLLWAICLSLASCGDGREPSGQSIGGERTDSSAAGMDTSDGGDTGGARSICSPLGNLAVVTMDIWAQELEAEGIGEGWYPVPSLGDGARILPLGGAASITLELEADLHLPIRIEVSFSGLGGPDAFGAEPPTEGRIAAAYADLEVEGQTCPSYILFVGLEHLWFASAAAPPTRSGAELLINGESFWSAVQSDLEEAGQRVTWSTWWWDSDFELYRSGDLDLTEGQRSHNTSMGLLQRLQGVDRKLLINRFWAENLDWAAYLNTDSELRDAAESDVDGIDVILQGNGTESPVSGEYDAVPRDFSFSGRVGENPLYSDLEMVLHDGMQARSFSLDAASWHQKMIAIDGRIAYVTGMNTTGTDWDDDQHLVFNPLRMDIGAGLGERTDVLMEEVLPDHVPRRDYGLRLEGPAARQAEAVFWQRWEDSRSQGLLYAENTTAFGLDGAAEAPEDAVQVQITATLPSPVDEMSIFETHSRAVRQAKQYIFIEDQYFRAPMLNELILERMQEEPELLLIVATMEVDESDPGLKHTYLSDRAFAEAFPDRYLLLQLRATELLADEGWLYDDVEVLNERIYTHSKLRIVDDVFLSVGSCNMNNRGYKYEGELNASVLDRDFVQEQRRRIFLQYVGEEYAEYLSDDARNNFDVLRIARDYNQLVLDWWEDNQGDLDAAAAEEEWVEWRPSGFVFPLAFSESYFDVGPDLF